MTFMNVMVQSFFIEIFIEFLPKISVEFGCVPFKYIYSFGICHLHMTRDDATFLTSIFWVFFTIFRFLSAVQAGAWNLGLRVCQTQPILELKKLQNFKNFEMLIK